MPVRVWQPVAIALQFLTRLPIPATKPVDSITLGRSLLAYPLVGLVVGLFATIPAYLAPGRDPLVTAALMLAVWVVVTGGLHLDGLADSADAWLGGQGSPERTLEIMKDPRAGPAAVVLVVLTLLLKVTALSVLVRHQSLLPVLLIPMLGRAAIIALFLTTRYVRAGGIGETLARAAPRRAGWVAVGIVALLFLAGGSGGLQALVCSVLGFLGVRALMVARLGGTTGDTAGALLELCETFALLGWALAF